MLLDELMPRYDVVERHATVVRAAPAATYAAIREAEEGIERVLESGEPVVGARKRLRLLHFVAATAERYTVPALRISSPIWRS